MSQKKNSDKNENLPSTSQTESQEVLQSRRNIVKSVVVGGGAVTAASQLAPKQWASPIVDSIVLPAHAQTSLVVNLTGTYGGSVAVTDAGNPKQQLEFMAQADGVDHTILDFLVPSAQATHARTGWCQGMPAPELTFSIDETDGSVGICAMWYLSNLSDDSDDDSDDDSPPSADDSSDDGGTAPFIYSTTSTLTGNNIADFSITGGDDGVGFGGGMTVMNCMVSSDGQTVTGDVMANGDGIYSCSGTFSCAKTSDTPDSTCGAATATKPRTHST